MCESISKTINTVHLIMIILFCCCLNEENQKNEMIISFRHLFSKKISFWISKFDLVNSVNSHSPLVAIKENQKSNPVMAADDRSLFQQ